MEAWQSLLLDSSKLKDFLSVKLENFFMHLETPRGLYAFHDIPLKSALSRHMAKWSDLSDKLLSITKTSISEGLIRGFTFSEILIVILCMKSQMIFGTIPEDIKTKLSSLEVHHQLPSNSWKDIFSRLCHTSSTGSFCSELGPLLREAVFQLADRFPFPDPPQLKQFQACQTAADASEQLLENGLDTIIFLSIGGFDPESFDRPEVGVLMDIEDGRVGHLQSLLLQVQLTIRVVYYFQRYGGTCISPLDLEQSFSHLKLVSINSVLKNNPMYDLFKAPQLFEPKGKPIYVSCTVSLGGDTVETCLELQILFFLFGFPGMSRDLLFKKVQDVLQA